MDKFVEAMLKSAKEKKQVQPYTADVDVKEIERITEKLNSRLREGKKSLD